VPPLSSPKLSSPATRPCGQSPFMSSAFQTNDYQTTPPFLGESIIYFAAPTVGAACRLPQRSSSLAVPGATRRWPGRPPMLWRVWQPGRPEQNRGAAHGRRPATAAI
jgi:hypothetical protein